MLKVDSINKLRARRTARCDLVAATRSFVLRFACEWLGRSARIAQDDHCGESEVEDAQLGHRFQLRNQRRTDEPRQRTVDSRSAIAFDFSSDADKEREMMFKVTTH